MFTLKKSDAFWWNVEFDWVNEDGVSEVNSIRFRFKRTTLPEFLDALEALNAKREKFPKEEQSRFIPDKELMIDLIVDVDDDVEVEGETDKRRIISKLLEYRSILSATVQGYQDATMRGGQSLDAVKK